MEGRIVTENGGASNVERAYVPLGLSGKLSFLLLPSHLYPKSVGNVLIGQNDCVPTTTPRSDASIAAQRLQRFIDLRVGRQGENLCPGAVGVVEALAEFANIARLNRVPAIIARLR